MFLQSLRQSDKISTQVGAECNLTNLAFPRDQHFSGLFCFIFCCPRLPPFYIKKRITPNLTLIPPIEGLRYFHDVILPRYEHFTRSDHHLPQLPDPENDPDDPELSGPSNVLAGDLFPSGPDLGDGERRGRDMSSRDGDRNKVMREQNRLERRGHSISSRESDLRNRDEVMREQSEVKNTGEVRCSSSYDLENTSKVTKHSDHHNSRSPTGLIHHDLTQSSKLQELEGMSYIPHKHDLDTLITDLSDSDDLEWETDGCEFEKVTLGHALGRNVAGVKGKKWKV